MRAMKIQRMTGKKGRTARWQKPIAGEMIIRHKTLEIEDIEDKEQPMDFGSENLQRITFENKVCASSLGTKARRLLA